MSVIDAALGPLSCPSWSRVPLQKLNLQWRFRIAIVKTVLFSVWFSLWICRIGNVLFSYKFNCHIRNAMQDHGVNVDITTVKLKCEKTSAKYNVVLKIFTGVCRWELFNIKDFIGKLAPNNIKLFYVFQSYSFLFTKN